MKDVKTSPAIDQTVEDSVSGAYELDLMAFFKILQDEAIKIIDENKDKPVEDIIGEINKLLG